MPAHGRQVPAASAAPSADAPRFAAVRTLAVDDQTTRVMSALDAHGVDALLLKGPAIARRLYAQEEQRFYGDTDVLVAPDCHAAAERTLRELGYQRLLGGRTLALLGDHGTHWRLRGSILEVDLHRTLTGVRADPAVLWQALCEHSSSLQVHGTTVRVPDTPALALHVALHAAQHGIAREKSLRDLEHALRRLEPAVWQTAAALAGRVDAVDAFGAGLRLLPAGEALAAQLGLPPNRSRQVALRVMGAPSMTLKVDRLRATPGPRARARLLLRSAFPRPDFMRIWSPLARKGRAGLLVTYVWRLCGLVGQIVPAILAWRRATRALERGS